MKLHFRVERGHLRNTIHVAVYGFCIIFWAVLHLVFRTASTQLVLAEPGMDCNLPDFIFFQFTFYWSSMVAVNKLECVPRSLIGLLSSHLLYWKTIGPCYYCEIVHFEVIDLYKIRYFVKTGLSNGIDLIYFKPRGLFLILDLWKGKCALVFLCILLIFSRINGALRKMA